MTEESKPIPKIEKEKALSCASFGRIHNAKPTSYTHTHTQKAAKKHSKCNKQEKNKTINIKKNVTKFEANTTRITMKKAKSHTRRGSMFPPQQRNNWRKGNKRDSSKSHRECMKLGMRVVERERCLSRNEHSC